MDAAQMERLLHVIVAWARTREDVLGLALIGSWARGAARPDSDVDLILLTETPGRFRSTDWLQEIDWMRAGARVDRWEDIDYGGVWSRHVVLDEADEVELSFGLPSWADVQPVDEGTGRVVKDGFQVLLDPDGLFARLKDAVLIG